MDPLLPLHYGPCRLQRSNREATLLKQAHTLLAAGCAGLPLDPADIVAAAGTAEADALAAAFDYSWWPGQGMQLALLQMQDLTGLPWCARAPPVRKPSRPITLCRCIVTFALTSVVHLGPRLPVAQVGCHHSHNSRNTDDDIPCPALGDEEHAQAVGA